MEKAFDKIVLDEYNTLSKGNSGFMKILLEKVNKQLEEYGPLIISDIQENRLDDLRDHTHYVKPMLVSLKLNTLLNVFESIKEQLEQGSYDEKGGQQQLSYIQKAIIDIRKQVQDKLESL